uniref:Serine/threonine-protein phosphatase 4 regulatory subunit 3-like central domain-containing protein n=1 Tax=Globisporangium ultimum (strain ATCC 200006 / CBS 805.95 / DAOM BR144) TaxID=431595 RepID=K3WLA1_GLOUD
MESHHFFSDEITERELPPCEIEKLDDILLLLKTTHPTVRSKTLRDLAADDGAYIVKLLDLFDICELDGEKPVLHRIFDIFYALVELCDRRLIEILLSDSNFLSVVGVFGYNPGLIREMDFRSALEGNDGFKEVIPIQDRNVLDRVHMNFRIHVIKDNVLSRSLPDCSVIMLDHMVNENNYHILSYISDTEEYWQAIKSLVRDKEKRLDGLGLLKEVIQLVRVTRPLDKLPQRRDGFGAPPVFGTLINNLFGDGSVFEAFGSILGSSESQLQEVELAVDILNILVFYQGPERLRTHLASEGRCIAPPTSDKDRICWKPGSSLFTALLHVFERYESTRVQMFTLLKEIFKVPLGHDDKFLSVLYPNYITWLLQPFKYTSVNDAPVLFALQDSIVELLTFCTEAHGYRVKYLFGRQPIASYIDQMLRSKNKLSVIQAVKFMRACVARAEAFFSRFLIQNDLFVPTFAHLKRGKRNDCAVSSAILELLAFIERSNLSSLIEHIYTKFYASYKDECLLVFQAIRLRYEDSFGSSSAPIQPSDLEKIKFVQNNGSMDDDEEMYWEKEDEPADSFVPTLSKESLSEEEVTCRESKPLKLVDYKDDDDDDDGDSNEPVHALKEGDLIDSSTTEKLKEEAEEEEDLKLPVREAKDEDESKSFFAGISTQKSNKTTKKSGETSALIAKRKLELEEAQTAESILKKSKTGTPISSS